MSKAEEELVLHLRAEKISGYQREYKFSRDIVGNAPGIRDRLKQAGLKDWRFDFAWPNLMLAVEVEGITSYGRNKDGSMRLGRHQSAKGIEGDLDKYQAAMRQGWTVYRCSPRMVKSGAAIETIKILIDQLANNP